MAKGSCFCGACSIEYTGDVQAKALCHCKDCRKITGSTYSTNYIVDGEGFSVKGSPKSIGKKGDDTGNTVTSYFCGDCGTTLYRDGATFGNSKVVKAGVLDDNNALEDAKPAVELYAPLRPSWVAAIGGADQKKNMPGSDSV
ncbi:uncharacterized protein LTR77_009545 [Saxophila tyrrhenica]|uniref:CENP-V/GFA domain-containing protein n=1 Tax=Saxophila tyrrhenica TaxID=1690608 RepID=A0AAV9NY48_9PEZI|nr:hypothetical protein LTR77_009545 [Saxophila tyrrhenica]